MALPSVNPAARPEPAPARARLTRAVAPLLWPAGLLAVSRVPAATRVVPGLGVLHGPLALVLIAAAAAVALARVVPRPRLREVPSGPLLAAAWTFLLAVGLSYTLRLRVSGDEPHYLLMAQSLWREHDLDLRDNLAREDWREY